MFKKLRDALDAAKLKDKLIVYTCRFNAFYDDSTRPAGYKAFPADGEGIAINKALQGMEWSSLK